MKHSFLKSILVALTVLSLGACKRGGGSEPEFIDYSESEEVRLSLDYKSRTFFSDGLEQVTLKSPIDGDTAHFYTASHEIIKARFWGIDTPESTGRIEEWGRAASNYTKGQLKEANENGTIVVSTPRDDYGVPSADSTGSRYVSLIWISLNTKNADFKDLRLLNLMIVQYGFSYVKNVDDIPAYQSIFIAAENQAKRFELHLFSKEEDSEFNYGDYETVALLDLKRFVERNIEGLEQDEDNKIYDGMKVRVVGTVAGFSGGTMYIQNFYTVAEGGSGNAVNPYTHEAGEYAGINIFCGMSAVPSKYTTLGTYIEICANFVVSEIFGAQLTGAEGHFPSVESLAEDDDCHILIKAVDNTEEYQLNTFEYTAAQLDAQMASTDLNVKYNNFYCSSKVTDAVECTRFYKNDNNEITLTFGNHAFQAYITTLYKGNPNDGTELWKTEDMFVGKSFYIEGVFTAYTGGTKPRFQFVFTNPTEQLHCTDYYNADGTIIEG